ncbi:glycine cleavage system protein R [Paludisphaera mucosa]|uniref:ACT domain-containing protein n=1 Tax=Paludisphaera mucosa TaxID=3030827 RepID=A0ABT6F784_9BACT|nr:ACT domain-containing protein [Paludisphaera mucosa]MDG3003341.1 ACT domain-containing protein [Paludisphaera mucosa]
MSSYMISVTAADRVGIVYSVTGALLDLGGNVLELSQTVMRGYFTIILEADFPTPRTRDQIVEAIHERGRRFDLQVQVTEIKEPLTEPLVPAGERFILTVLGDDSPGIVHNIAGSLAAHGANIVDLHARVEGSRFSLVMEALIPHDLTPAAIRSELERYGRAHKLEAFVQHENIFAATTEPSPVRLGAALRSQGDSLASH